MPSIVLAADCGGAAGWGHFIRCQALAGELAARQADVVLGVHGATPAHHAEVPLIRLAPSRFREYVTAALARSQLVVLDLREWESLDRVAGDRCARLAWISDHSEPPFPADLGIDPNVSSPPARYGARRSLILGGADHIILREQFDAPVPRQCSADAKRVLVGFGGTEQTEAVTLTLAALRRCELPIEEITLVGGRSALAAAEFPNGPRVRVAGYVEDMRSLFDRADLGVVAGGTMLAEACATGLPAIALSLNVEQAVEAAALAKRDVAVYLGPAREQSADSIVAALHALGPRASRERLARSAQALIDGNGRARVAQSLIALTSSIKTGALS
jgi:spore coat polysaccharide biosynthesis predicted glycosyltransferase SpsG